MKENIKNKRDHCRKNSHLANGGRFAGGSRSPQREAPGDSSGDLQTRLSKRGEGTELDRETVR